MSTDTLAVRFDAPTTLLRPVPTRSIDLWDDALHLARPRPVEDVAPPVVRALPMLVPAALTFLLAAIGLGRSALWTDELATWGMATTPWSQFWPVLRWVDAVLAPYYVVMHLWVDVFGDSDISLRLPSMLAMTGAAALVGAIGQRLAGRWAGLWAGVIFAGLASTSRFAVEARPYAMAVLASCVATFLLLRAWERPSRRRWVAYGLSLALLGWLQAVALLLVAAHLWSTIAFERRHTRWVAAAASGAVASSLVILAYGYRQRSQVAYIESVSGSTFELYTTVLFGGVAPALILVAVGLFSLPLRMPAAVFTAWAVIPTLGLLAVSTVLPLFLPRYLLFTVPGWALAAGVAVARVRPAFAASVVLLLAGLALPAQVAMRGTAGHGQDTRGAALIVGQGVQTGDGIIYADEESVGSWTARDAIAHYLPAAYRPQDVLATQPPRTGGHLLAVECPDVAACLNGHERLWLVRATTLDDPLANVGSSKEDILRAGYDVVQVWQFAGMTVALLQRTAPPGP